MRTITIGFSSPKKFKIGAELIKWWIDKSYSHVYVGYIDDQGRSLIFHSAHGMVHLVSRCNFIKDNDIILEKDITFNTKEYQEFRDYYYDKLGNPYSYIDLLKIPFYDMGFFTATENTSGYICSELLSEMLWLVKGVESLKQFNLMRPDDIEIQLLNGDYSELV
jgi:hypothetical protein